MYAEVKNSHVLYRMAFLLLMILLSLTDISKAEDVYKSSGTIVELVCPYKASNGKNLRWIHESSGGTLTTYSENNYITPSLPTELKQRLSISGDHSTGEYHLTISNLTYSDTGTYECSLTISEIHQQRLFLIDAPSSVGFEDVVQKEHLTGIEGHDLTIKCIAVGGNPDPDVTLHIPGLSIVPSSKRSVTHTLPTVDRSYDGKSVICKATNNQNIPEQKMDTAKIYLSLKPLLPAFSPDLVSTIETVPLVVTCKSHGSRPAGMFQWILEHNNINVTANSTQLTVYNTSADTYTVTSKLTVSIDRTYHRTYVVCGISNTAATTPITNRNILDIKYAPRIIVLNKTFPQNKTVRQIECTLDGNPAIYTFDKWQHRSVDGILIRELIGNSTLTLPSVPNGTRYQDAGEYICTASNGIKDKSGKIKQSGSGYVAVTTLPLFTSDNNISKIQHGIIGRNIELFVHVYSFPKFDTVKWFRDKVELKPRRYVTSEAPATLKDTFYGMVVELVGYRVTLTIYGLNQDDFANYTLRVYTGSQFVEHAVVLSPDVPSNIPTNFSITGSSQSTITIQWKAFMRRETNHTYNIEFRKQGSSIWNSVEILSNVNDHSDISYTLTGLQDGTVFEVRLYAKNAYNDKVYRAVRTIQTANNDSQTSCGSVVGGVAGGLVAVIIILSIILTIVLRRLQGRKASRLQQSAKEYKTVGMKIKAVEEEVTLQDTFQRKKNDNRTNTYEVAGTPDKPNLYDELRDKDESKQSSSNTYEVPGTADKPNLYDELKDRDKSKQRSEQQYETLGVKDKPNIYEELENKQKDKQKVYENKKTLSSGK